MRYHAKNPPLHRILGEQLPRVARLQANIQVRNESAQAVRMVLDQFEPSLRVKDLDFASFMVVSLVDMLIQVAVLERPEAVVDERFANELISELASPQAFLESLAGKHHASSAMVVVTVPGLDSTSARVVLRRKAFTLSHPR